MIPSLLVVFTRQLEILETTLGSPLNYGIIWLSLRVSGAVPKVNVMCDHTQDRSILLFYSKTES